ncbi:hypothetical protein [Acidimangrovimonas sediminis]|uniref:hypothetical protein n=1 Tax=Acidimangrovimonas sediminis TaxID=2056283 RepID=UPI000C802AC4|nr:hypothetical protein [Acidimangrovimonas sediminis]
MTSRIAFDVASPAVATWARLTMAERMARDLIEGGTGRADTAAVRARLRTMGWSERLIAELGETATEFADDIEADATDG